jgi:hypothetical protein
VATAWPSSVLGELQASFSKEIGKPSPITWVILAPGEPLDRVVDRRGGVDILLGGSVEDHDGLAVEGHSVAIYPERGVAWDVARRPDTGAEARSALEVLNSLGSYADPRDDPASLALSKAVLEAAGWDKGYEALVRHASRSRLDRATRGAPGAGEGSREGVSLSRGSRNPLQARQFLEFLEKRALLGAAGRREVADSKSDGLLADLLGSAMVDAREELRQAGSALERFGHTAAAEAAMGQRPPWPPASLAKLRGDSSGESLVETLLEQIAPDLESRDFLLKSWSRPSRMIDGALLDELGGAAEGRLVREPRFRAWLRGEWTAWTRQLYRRVARVAGGYIPS